MTVHVCAWGFIWTSLFIFVNGQTGDDAKVLRNKLFTSNAYDKAIRPTDNQTDPIGMSHVMNFQAA